METITLRNGLRCIFHPMPNTHSVTIGLYIKAGPGYHGSLGGITHLLEHLHFRQLDEISQDGLYYAMESIGSTLRGTTYRDLLTFSMKVAPVYVPEALKIILTLINANTWTTDNFNAEKRVVANQIEESEEHISIDQEARKYIFKKHPLSRSIMGEADQLNAIVLDDVIKYKKLIFSSSNMIVCLTGKFDESIKLDIMDDLSRCIVSRHIDEVDLMYPQCFHKRKPDIAYVHKHNSDMLDVNISFDISYTNSDFDCITILNCILGEGVGSKLQKRIREEQSYTSNIGSYIEWYPHFAVLHICFSVESSKFYSCLVEIFSIIESMKDSVSTEDLSISLPFYTTNHVFYEDDTEEMNYQLGYNQLIHKRMFNAITLQNSATTSAKIITQAKHIFNAKNCCIVLVGNTKGISKSKIQQIVREGAGGAQGTVLCVNTRGQGDGSPIPSEESGETGK